MVRSIVFAAAFICVAPRVFGEVDFTPKDSFYLAEATRVPDVAFQNGSRKITYSPPGGWTLSGGGRKLSLTPPDTVQAGAVMQTDPIAAVVPATEENVKAYSDVAVGLLPREASKVTVVDAAICSMRIAQRSMVEVTLTYVLFGQHFTSNILFLPYDKEQIIFQVTARNADYTPLAKAFRASLFSLQGL
ncbi:MAG: hypothetical protein ABJF10_02560 [Chthoniobacter sp.]|uniref:hypothetical protein n=1 Tax=Chthoniobacter sp. TaxID=2510640 RepID=UPI0032ABA8C8